MSGMLRVEIAGVLSEACPNLRLGVVVGSVPRIGEGAAAISAGLDALPLMAEDDPWLEAMAATFRRAGANPKRHAPSATALVRRLATGRGIYRINDLVDTNNLLSLQLRVPLGIYDRDHLAGSRLTFDLGAPQPAYTGIDGVEQRTVGKLLLTDRDKVVGGPHADAQPTRITESTRHFLSVLFYPDWEESPKAVAKGVAIAREGFETYCGATVLKTEVVG